MREVDSWDTYFLRLCDTIATRSKDPSTQVGAIIVRDNAVLSQGYNGFPRGIDDTATRWERPAKYDIVVHAEMNAIMTAARYGHALDGATLYCSLMPCAGCAKHIIQAGVREVVVNATISKAYQSATDHGFVLAVDLFCEAGVRLRFI